MNRYGVIMAGGGGTRFWPLSRRKMPKQFLNLTGKAPLVNETIDRIAGNVPMGNIYIVTNAEQAPLMEETTAGRLGKGRILAEPAARNTAACIGYAAIAIRKQYGDSVMCVLPSDHYVRDTDAYKEVMDFAMDLAEKTDRLVTIGIKPTEPATGYGYIKYNKRMREIAHRCGKPETDYGISGIGFCGKTQSVHCKILCGTGLLSLEQRNVRMENFRHPELF